MKKQTIEIKLIDWWDEHHYRIRYINEAKVEVEDYFASVSTKLNAKAKPYLIKWYGDIGGEEARRITMEKADRGSRIHHAWYTYTQGGAVVYQPERAAIYNQEEFEAIQKKYSRFVMTLRKQDEMYDMMKLQQFMQIVKPTNVMSEFIVYNIAERDAGTVDNAMDIKEGEYMVAGATPLKLPTGRYIFDLKTGSDVSDAPKQLAAYMVAAESMDLDEVKFAGCLIGHTGAQVKKGIDGFKLIYIPREEALEHYKDYRDIARVWERNFSTKKPVIRQIPGLIAMGL